MEDYDWFYFPKLNHLKVCPFGQTFSPATKTLAEIESSTCRIQVHSVTQLSPKWQFYLKYLPKSLNTVCQIEIIGPVRQRKLNFGKSQIDSVTTKRFGISFASNMNHPSLFLDFCTCICQDVYNYSRDNMQINHKK